MSVFRRGEIQDFERMLDDRIKRAKETIEREGAKSISMLHARGMSGAGRAPIEIADAVTPEYETALAELMRLVADFAHQSGQPIRQLTDIAKPKCEILFSTAMDAIRQLRVWNQVASLHTELNDRFRSRLENDFKNIEMGFIQGERIVEKPFQGIQGNAMLLLKAMYDICREEDGPVFLGGPKLSLSEGDQKAAWRYLTEKGLLKEFNLPFSGRISAAGIDAIEGALRHPDISPKEFPSITYNIVNNNIGSAVNSPIQQAGSHSTQAQTIAYGPQQLNDLNRLVTELTNHIDDLKLGPVQRKKAVAQVDTIKAQLADTPNPVIVREAAHSLRNIVEGAIAGLAAEAIKPEIWDWIHHALMLFSRQ